MAMRAVRGQKLAWKRTSVSEAAPKPMAAASDAIADEQRPSTGRLHFPDQSIDASVV